MHAHVVDEEDLLADLGIGMLTDGVTEDQVRQATVVHKVEHHLQVDVALCCPQAPIILEQMRRAMTAQESKTRRQNDEHEVVVRVGSYFFLVYYSIYFSIKIFFTYFSIKLQKVRF